MKIYVESSQEEMEFDFSGRAKDLLQKLKINPVTVLFVKNDNLVSEEEQIENSDNIRILSVVSGG